MSAINFDYPEHIYNTQSAEKVVPYLIDCFHPASVLDIGCGIGTWLVAFTKFGVRDIVGVDGDYVLDKKIFIPSENLVTLNLEKSFDLKRKFDLVLSLEVAEHLNISCAQSFVDNLIRHGDTIVFSAAVPGQGGDGHVNEQPPFYWQKLFEGRGYHTYDFIRPAIWNDDSIHWWYRQNIFLASRQPIAQYANASNISYFIHPGLYELKGRYIEDLQASLGSYASGKHSPSTYFKLLVKSVINKLKRN